MTIRYPTLLFCLATLLAASPVTRALDTVVTLPPLHSLVAAVTTGVADPRMLVESSASGHHHTLTPSRMAALQSADLFVWVGPGLESYLVKALRNPVPGRHTIQLATDIGVSLRPRRHGLWDEAREREDADDDAPDMHLWLDPQNALAIVAYVAVELIRLDPDNAERYRENAAVTGERLVDLDHEIAELLAPVRDRPFIVYHDAFQYFDARYELNAIAAISDSDEHRPGAAHLSSLRRLLREQGVDCVFLEPGADPRLAAILTEDTPARIAYLDPLGTTLAPGPDLYFELLRANAHALAECLSSSAVLSLRVVS